MSEIVCLIPARKGSKRLVGKNTAEFHGRPLACWTFDFALDCDAFTRIILSTDDENLERLAPEGIETLPRPAELVGDSATLFQVIHHVIADAQLSKDDVIVLTPVTAPLRTRVDLDGALAVFDGHRRERTVFTVCRNPYAPHLLFTMDQEGGLAPIIDRAKLGTRKQAYPTTYFWNDAFLIDTVSNFLQSGRDLYGANPAGADVPPERSVPIDHPFDIQLARQLFDQSISSRGARQS